MKELKVLIVDDEIMAIEYLRDLIPWNEYGFAIVGEAINFSQALELFNKHRPQIIISDICMPGISGLELCKRILSIDPKVKILLLTAYKDFEYAKKAIELGVSNYLVKHEITEGMLLEILGRLKEEVEKENNTDSILKKHLIIDYIEGYNDTGNQNEVKWNDMENDSGEFILALFKEDVRYPVMGSDSEPVSIDACNELAQIYSDLPQGLTYIDCFHLRNKHVAILFSNDTIMSHGQFWNLFYPIAAKTQDLFQRMTGKTFSAVICHDRQRIRNITRLYKNALNTLKHTVFYGTGRIVDLQYFTPCTSEKGYMHELENRLKLIPEALKRTDSGKTGSIIDDIFSNIILPSRSLKLLRTACDELLSLLNAWCRNCSIEPVQYGNPDMTKVFDKCFTIKDISNAVRQIYKMKQDEVVDEKLGSYSQKVQNAIKYLYDNYRKPITVSDVAKTLDVSESYLSRIFRNETGKTVLEYLTIIRIEKAKRLLNKQVYKIYEVAEMVGYNTSQYFSQVFIKMTGMNPLEYRERGGQNG